MNSRNIQKQKLPLRLMRKAVRKSFKVLKASFKKSPAQAAPPTNGNPPFIKNKGYCPTCNSNVTFIAKDNWLRDHYICSHCGSIPRERALMYVLETYFPNWKALTIHESSSGNHGASVRIARECQHYLSSQYFAGVKSGSLVNGIRCENLESLSFNDESIDLHITQDVMEHVLAPLAAFREIARTLKPGGAHVFTVPLVNKDKPTKLRTKLTINGQLEHLEPPVYHGNPMSAEGSLVIVDWGFDICRYIFDACGLFTHVVKIDDLSKGIRAEFIEVLITYKPTKANRGDIIP